MANKNTKIRQRALRKESFVTGGFKKKVKNYPQPNGDGPSLSEQRKQFYGNSFIA